MSQRKIESAFAEELIDPLCEQAFRQAMVHAMADAFCIKDTRQRYLYCNPQMAKILGVEPSAAVGRTDEELLRHSVARREAERRVLESGIAESLVCKIQTDRTPYWFDVNTMPLRQPGESDISGVCQWLHDISDAYLERGLYLGQSRILQRIATGSELNSVLLEITELVEELMPEALCSIHIRDKKTNTLYPGPAPHIPVEYIRYFTSVPIEEGIGSCGTAAYRGKTIVVSDIEHDPLWRDYAHIALAFDLRSCWSVPVFATTHQHLPNQVLGTFAVYGHQPSSPRPEQLQVLQVAAYLAGIAIDISERQRAESELLEAAQLLNAVASGASDAIFVKDTEGKYLFYNQVASTLVGRPADEIIGRYDKQLFDEASALKLREIDQAVMQSNQPCSTEETVTVAGVTRVYSVLKTPYRDEQGQSIGVIGIARDISERKRTEAALIESEERYRMAINATHDFIWDVDLIGSRVTWSDRYDQVFGRPKDAPYSWQWWRENIHPDDRERTVAAFKDAIASDQQYCTCDYRLQRKDGTWADVHDTAYIARDDNGVAYRIVGAMNDVTKQKQSERLQNRLLRLIDQCKDFIALADMSGRLTFMNAGARRMVGIHEHADVTQFHLSDLVAPSCKTRFWDELMPQVLQQGLWEDEMQLSHLQDGKLIDVYRTTFLIHDDYGTPCIASVTRDVSAAKQSEKELRASQQTVQAVLAASPITIYVLDLKAGRFQFATWQLLVELGFIDNPRTEWTWQAYQALIHPDDLQKFLGMLEQCHAGTDAEIMECEYRIRDVHGEWRWIAGRHVAFASTDDVKQAQIIGTAQDVTARKELEQHVRESQKSDAIGRLAGGVAHDFNNLLTVINGQADLLLAKVRPEDFVHAGLKEVRDAGQRAAQLTRQLLSFGRRAIVAPRVLDLSAMIMDSANLIRRFLGEHITLTLQLEADNAFVIADASQIDQLLLNLVVNARDAMPDGGALTISTHRVSQHSIAAMNMPDAVAGEYIQIIVRDTGTGMPSEVVERAFEPFFTTKPTGQGTGLGLAVVQGIVKQTGGHISLHSQPNQGSEFTIWLPATNDRPEEAALAERYEVGRPKGATILLVEDEPGVRGLMRDALGTEGYYLLEACDPEDAKQLLEQYGAPIDLLITDIMMPRENGQALASALRDQVPTLPVLYITGYSTDLPQTSESNQSIDRLLRKPFSPGELRAMVAEILNAHASAQ